MADHHSGALPSNEEQLSQALSCISVGSSHIPSLASDFGGSQARQDVDLSQPLLSCSSQLSNSSRIPPLPSVEDISACRAATDGLARLKDETGHWKYCCNQHCIPALAMRQGTWLDAVENMAHVLAMIANAPGESHNHDTRHTAVRKKRSGGGVKLRVDAKGAWLAHGL
jgi:hypothetical protein